MPLRGDARVDKALNIILGHLLRGDRDLAKTTKFNSPTIGPTTMDVSLGECCGFRKDPIIKKTPWGSDPALNRTLKHPFLQVRNVIGM